MATSKTVKDVRTLLQEAKRPEDYVYICLRGDLTAQINELDKELAQLQQEATVSGDDKRFVGNPAAKKLAEKIKKLEIDAEKATIPVLVRAFPKRRWQELKAKHPSKKKDEDLDLAGLFAEGVPEAIAEPEMDADTRDKFLDSLTDGQFESIAYTMYGLNQGEGGIPKSVLASRALRSTDET